MQIHLTEDGSHTLFSEKLGECYHSQHGAVQESEHIFIHAGFNKCIKSELNVLEVGFGTGLNAFLTLLKSDTACKKINYTAIELYPVEESIVEQLNYSDIVGGNNDDDFYKIHRAVWGQSVAINDWFSLTKIQDDFTQVNLEGIYDLIYFDAFSPEKQPEMWTQKCFDMLYRHADTGCVLVTYCAKGIVRRAMQQAGFQVERLPGPPGKREILRAIKL